MFWLPTYLHQLYKAQRLHDGIPSSIYLIKVTVLEDTMALTCWDYNIISLESFPVEGYMGIIYLIGKFFEQGQPFREVNMNEALSPFYCSC